VGVVAVEVVGVVVAISVVEGPVVLASDSIRCCYMCWRETCFGGERLSVCNLGKFVP
jgi:hypothetical protein